MPASCICTYPLPFLHGTNLFAATRRSPAAGGADLLCRCLPMLSMPKRCYRDATKISKSLQSVTLAVRRHK